MTGPEYSCSPEEVNPPISKESMMRFEKQDL